MAVKVSREEQITVARAMADFRQFLPHVQINAQGRGVIPWEPWGYLQEIALLFLVERFISILKARQLGLSWLVAAYAVWKSCLPNSLTLFLSQGEMEAWELLAKAEFVRTHLPWGMPRLNDSRTEIDFKNGSKILALPSTEKAGSGYEASLVVLDEHAKHPYPESNFATLFPTINDSGGQMISLSSNFGSGSFSTNLYQDAKKGINGFKARFLGCFLRPGRDQAWWDRTKANFKGLAAYFAREYPRTEEEALSAVDGICAFDVDALTRLLENARSPISQEERPLATLRTWQRPVPGHKYVCGTDVSYGLAATDAAVSQILDGQTGLHVASLWGHLPPEEHIDWTVKLCQEYNDAFLGCEENGVGQFAIRRLADTAYHNVYYRDAEEAYQKHKYPEKLGWHTGSNRPAMIAGTAQALRNGELVSWDKDTIGECKTFILTDAGREEAAKGCHDDRVMSLAIAWEMREYQRIHGNALPTETTRGIIEPRRFLTLR